MDILRFMPDSAIALVWGVSMQPPGKQVAVSFHQLGTPKTSNPVA